MKTREEIEAKLKSMQEQLPNFSDTGQRERFVKLMGFLKWAEALNEAEVAAEADRLNVSQGVFVGQRQLCLWILGQGPEPIYVPLPKKAGGK